MGSLDYSYIDNPYTHSIIFLISTIIHDLPVFFIRAEELETALMEMVKQDNRRQLSARVHSKYLKTGVLFFLPLC